MMVWKEAPARLVPPVCLVCPALTDHSHTLPAAIVCGAHQVHPDHPARLALLDPLEAREVLVHPEVLVALDLVDHPDLPAMLDLLDPLEVPVPLEVPALGVPLAARETTDPLVEGVNPAQVVPPETVVPLVIQALLVHLAHLALAAPLEALERGDHPALLVNAVAPAQMPTTALAHAAPRPRQPSNNQLESTYSNDIGYEPHIAISCVHLLSISIY